jgi:hypothetical protein
VASAAEKLARHRLHLPALDLGREEGNGVVPADLRRAEESGDEDEERRDQVASSDRRRAPVHDISPRR